ncbi:MAG: DEAD/DEAH box helicase [Acholeplasmatales bacterium]|nr:DEAD/DEAH box helicase [Acholeplasmatales bacterium]
MKTFEELQISEVLVATLNELNITESTKIQELSIPLIKEGKDIIAQAKTGTGKTFSYLLPILEKINLLNKNIQALIICPTRELANQVSDEIFKLTKNLRDIKYATITGGASYEKQFKQLSSRPQLVVSTPGRILDHMERKTINISYISFLVLDEADEMLKMGFKEDLENIIKTTPETKQTLLFSATIPPFIKKIATTYQHNPVFINTDNGDSNVAKIKQYYYDVKKKDKLNLLVRIIDLYQFDSAIIFANTKLEVDEINDFLNKNNIPSSAIHGDLKQHDRDTVMALFKKHKIKILVGSDVAARGLDIEDVNAVINYELPFEPELYIHRIGRTGRADKKGASFSLVAPTEKSRLRTIISLYKPVINLKEIPTKEDLQNVINVKNKSSLDELISNNKNSHTTLALSLLASYPAEQIIDALLKNSIIGDREYPEIETVKNQKDNNRGSTSSYDNKDKARGKASSSNSQSRDAKTFIKVEINLGEDVFTKSSFLEFLDQKLKIYSRHIKNVKTGKTKTSFEIEHEHYRYLVKANDRMYFNKKVIIKTVK